MRAGELKRRVIIETAVDTQDDSNGEMLRTWTTLATVWAKVEPLRGREFYGDGAIREEMDTRITMRYAPALLGLSAKHRMRHSPESGPAIVYNIVSPAHVLLNHREIEVMAKSGVNDG